METTHFYRISGPGGDYAFVIAFLIQSEIPCTLLWQWHSQSLHTTDMETKKCILTLWYNSRLHDKQIETFRSRCSVSGSLPWPVHDCRRLIEHNKASIVNNKVMMSIVSFSSRFHYCHTRLLSSKGFTGRWLAFFSGKCFFTMTGETEIKCPSGNEDIIFGEIPFSFLLLRPPRLITSV